MNTQVPVLQKNKLFDRNHDIFAFVPGNFKIDSDFALRFIDSWKKEIGQFESIVSIFAASPTGSPALRQILAKPSLMATEISSDPSTLNYELARSLNEMRIKINSMYWNGLMQELNAPQLFPAKEMVELTTHYGHRKIVKLKELYEQFHISDLGADGYSDFESVEDFSEENIKKTLDALVTVYSKEKMIELLKGYDNKSVLNFIKGQELEVRLLGRQAIAYIDSILTILAMLNHGEKWVEYLADFRFNQKLDDSTLNKDVARIDNNSKLLISGSTAEALIELLKEAGIAH